MAERNGMPLWRLWVMAQAQTEDDAAIVFGYLIAAMQYNPTVYQGQVS